jgi:hypothetical protein
VYNNVIKNEIKGLLKHDNKESYKGREHEEEDTSRYWLTSKNTGDPEI